MKPKRAARASALQHSSVKIALPVTYDRKIQTLRRRTIFKGIKRAKILKDCCRATGSLRANQIDKLYPKLITND